MECADFAFEMSKRPGKRLQAEAKNGAEDTEKQSWNGTLDDNLQAQSPLRHDRVGSRRFRHTAS